MINDMGITVYEKAPDAESLLLSDSAVSNDEDAADEAAAALATVDAEFGRTTDPVRMYMREMGTVELLTREGEIRIAKRIEEGLDQVRAALAAVPADRRADLRHLRPDPARRDASAGFDHGLHRSERANRGSERARRRAGGRAVARRESDDSDAEEDAPETGPDPEEVAARLKKVKRLHKRYLETLEANGIKHASTKKALKSLTNEFMELKLAPKIFDAMVAQLRDVVNQVRGSGAPRDGAVRA